MNPNPYAPPAADDEAERLTREGRRRRRRTWRVYAFFLAGLCGLTYAYAAATDFRAIVIPDMFIGGVGLAGLFGFAFRRPLLHPRLWVAWAVLLPLWDVLFGFVLYRAPEDAGGTVATALSLLLVLPEYVALWRYAHFSKDLWAPPA